VNDPKTTVRDAGTIGVLIVDDHPMVRKVVRWACEGRPALSVLGEATDGNEALELCASLKPDIVVLDLGLPGLDGIEVAKRLRQTSPAPRILVLTGNDDAASLFDSMRAQVDGYLEKSGALENIGELIEQVAGGQQAITSEQEQVAISRLGDLVRNVRESSRVGALLTDRELEVAGLIAEALTTHQMARRLGLSERTVESHISNLYKKLGAKNRVEAIGKAQRLGLIPGP
jgi:DNA-binding NarL/FixJ family response regulator